MPCLVSLVAGTSKRCSPIKEMVSNRESVVEDKSSTSTNQTSFLTDESMSTSLACTTSVDLPLDIYGECAVERGLEVRSTQVTCFATVLILLFIKNRWPSLAALVSKNIFA